MLIENPDIETTCLQEVLVQKIEGYTRKVSSECPMCRRVYGLGDALCNCGPQVVEKPGPEGNPVKVMRVVGMTNRHGLRTQISDSARAERKYRNTLRWKNIFQARKEVQNG
jgi:hypothetical protein